MNKCEAIPSTVIPKEQLKKLRNKSFGERHVIMQRRAKACQESRKK